MLVRALSLLLLLAAAQHAIAQDDAAAAGSPPDSRGRLAPAAGVPEYDPSRWSAAYKLTVTGVPFKGERTSWPRAFYGSVDVPSDCSSEGFATTSPKDVPLGACFYRNATDGKTFDIWIKKRSLARNDANCYCYALDVFQGGFCIPGKTSGVAAKYNEKMTCAAVNEAVTKDGAVPVSRQEALSGQPSSGHYIAMLARPAGSIPGHSYDSDFHAVRKDASGTWSWKLPTMPPSDRDLFGKLITDPESAPMPGHYQVCGYFRVEPSKMKVDTVGASPGPLADDTPSAYRDERGVQVDISPSPWNPRYDAAIPARDEGILSEDRAWELQRGGPAYKRWLADERQQLGLDTGGSGSGSGGSIVQEAGKASGSGNGLPRNQGPSSPAKKPAQQAAPNASSGRRLRNVGLPVRSG